MHFLQPIMDIKEDILIEALKHDSQRALREIYRMYSTRLYAFCMQYTKSRESSEELVEDAFVWLWVNRHRIRQEQTVRGLLFIRVKHYLINAYRSTIHSPQFEDYCQYAYHLADDSYSEPMEYDEFLSQVNSALEQLPDTQRKVVRLSKLERLSNMQISKLLGLKEQTVKNQLSLGLKTLRQVLKLSYMLATMLLSVN